MDSLAKTRRRFRRAPLAAAVLLGPLTTIGVAWASAAWLPVDDGRGTVALDGDHLQPWLIRLDRVSATRVIWFEKGRIWGRPMTTQGPSRVLLDGTMIAMNCWSFAIRTRGDPDYCRGEIVLPEPMQALIARSNPQVCWGVARDQRGWPLPALTAQIIGTLDPAAPEPLTVRDSIMLTGPPRQRKNLATVRALPLAPIWGGLVADSAFFTGSWWLALAAVARGVAYMRKRLVALSGLCPGCRYDLRGELATGCPECGWNRQR